MPRGGIIPRGCIGKYTPRGPRDFPRAGILLSGLGVIILTKKGKIAISYTLDRRLDSVNSEGQQLETFTDSGLELDSFLLRQGPILPKRQKAMFIEVSNISPRVNSRLG